MASRSFVQLDAVQPTQSESCGCPVRFPRGWGSSGSRTRKT